MAGAKSVRARLSYVVIGCSAASAKSAAADDALRGGAPLAT